MDVTSVLAVPPDLLIRIFASLHFEDRLATSLVCRNWSGVHSDCINRIWEAAKLCSLQPRLATSLFCGNWAGVHSDGINPEAANLCSLPQPHPVGHTQACKYEGLITWRTRRAACLRLLELHDGSFDGQTDSSQRPVTHGMLWGATTRAWGGNRPGAPLEALRIHGLEPSVCLLTQFSGTLRHLVLPDLSLNGVYALRPVLTNLPLLETLDTVIVYGPERLKTIPDGLGEYGDPDMQLLHAAASCCKRLNHLNIVISISASPGMREVDFAAELSTLTALSVLRLDVIPMDTSIPESTRLLLPTASLRYLSLQKDRDNTYPRETHGLSRLTGLEVLRIDCLSWGCPLPHCLSALGIELPPVDDPVVVLPQLSALLRDLPLLQHFNLRMQPCSSLTPFLTPLLVALCLCALTCLDFAHCGLEELPAACVLPAYLEVINLDSNVKLALDDWLPALAVLPRLHSINLQGIPLDGATAVRCGVGAARALQRLWCNPAGMELLVEERAVLGLPPLTMDSPVLLEYFTECAAVLDPPPISFGSCAVLPTPQLNNKACGRSDIDGLGGNNHNLDAGVEM